MKLGKAMFFVLVWLAGFNLAAQSSTWQSNPQDLLLDCEIGVDHSAAIQAWLDSDGGGTISQECTTPIVTNDYAGLSPDCAGADTVLVTFTLVDDCNMPVQASAVIRILDQLPPTFDQSVEDIILACDGSTPDLPSVTIADLCDPSPSLKIVIEDDQTNDGTCSDINYILQRLWIATDACGNADTLIQKITYLDSTPPTFQGPADLVLTCEDNTEPISTGQPTNIQDNCSNNNQVMMEEFVFFQGCVNNFTITRLWTVVDVCGNVSPPFEQTIIVQDFTTPTFTTAPTNQIFECSNPMAAESAFQTWINNHASAVAADNCTAVEDLTWFVAVPGSYDLNNMNTWPGTSPGTLAEGDCEDSVNGVIRMETVDFVVYDECNRIIAQSATFSVVDQSPPIFSYCPADLTLASLDNSCEVNWTLLLPDLDETCDNEVSSYSNSTSVLISSDEPGNTVIVNPVKLSLTGLPTPPATPTQAVEITINLSDVDGELPTEFFNIYLSDGTLIGPATLTDVQCGSSETKFSLSPSQFQLLTLNGNFEVDLIPNVPVNQTPNFGINDICGNSIASLSLQFDYNFPTDFEITYSLDGGSAVALDFNNPPNFSLDLGNHSVAFVATDCAGNSSNCQYNIVVKDELAPIITCPSNIDYSLQGTDDCSAGPAITLPYPIFVSEDCSYLPYSQLQPTIANDALITFEYDPDYLEYTAQSKSFSFTNVQANAAGTDVIFRVEVKGDNQNADDYFLILGENGNIVGATRVGLPNVTFTPGSCPNLAPIAVAEIHILRDVYNEWAKDGTINLTAQPNRNFNLPPPGVAGDGINPVCTTFAPGTADGTNDGLSSISITLEMQTAQLIYQVAGATTIGPSLVPYPAGVPTINFGIGTSQVTYSVSDLEGNTGTCSFEVQVTDTIQPIANCQATTIFINPSGLVNYELDPSEVDAGSSDNCGILEYTVYPNNFSCNDIGKDTMVTLVVTDAAGNKDSCQTLVAIEGELAMPNYSISLCGNDTLFLFANPPAAIGGVIYTYLWSGPNNFTSTNENPVILNADVLNAGSYAVQIEGITGCTTMATVEVTLNADLAQPTISQPGVICEGDDLTLFVNIADGESYTWIAPNFSTINTLVPFLQIPNIDQNFAGNWSVTVLRNGCTSPQATPVNVMVEALPNILAANNGPVCAGTVVELSANAIPGASYQWSGPNNFSAVLQTTSAAAAAGNYTVTATSPNGCSATATTSLEVLPLPTIDELIFSGAACVDGTTDIQLISLVSGGSGNYTYNWSGPVPAGTGASITLVNATAAVNGEYQLVVTDGMGCQSTASSINIAITDVPSTPTITGAGTICQGGDILLTTTSYPGQPTYTWLTGTSEITTTQPTLLLEDVVDSTILQVFVTVDGCNSSLSPIVQIPVIDMLVEPTISGPSSVCSGESIQLETEIIPGADYSWTGPAGFTASVFNPIVFQSGLQNEGNYQVQIEQNGCISPLSENFFVEVNENPPTPTATADSEVCLDEAAAMIALTVSSSTAIAGASYTWYNTQTNDPIGAAVNTLNFSFAPDASYSEGVAEFYVIAENEGCGSTQSIPVAVNLFEIPDGEAFAGDDFLLCDAISVTLDANDPTIGSGMWQQNGGPSGAILADPLDANSVLTNLENGETYTYDWVLSNGACAAYDQASVNIEYQIIPVANDDSVIVPFAGETSFNVKENDQIDVQFFIDVLEGPFEGTVEEGEEGEFTYLAGGNFAGDDYLVYQVCNQVCPEVCTEATVEFNVGENAACDVPTIFTPNEDGVNDSFIIPCLASDKYPSHAVFIVNQYGDEVFNASPYENDWRGTYNGEELPVGTYYYVIEFGNGKAPQAGFVILER